MTDTAIDPAALADDGPPWHISVLLAELIERWARDLAEAEQRCLEARREGYAEGHDAGYEAGRRDEYTDQAEHWAQLSRRIRADAARIKGTATEPPVRSNGIPDASVWFSRAEWAALMEAGR